MVHINYSYIKDDTLGFQRPLFLVFFPVKTYCFAKDVQLTNPGDSCFLKSWTCRVDINRPLVDVSFFVFNFNHLSSGAIFEPTSQQFKPSTK